VWCGVVWCGVVWCGVVWCGVVWCGVVWCGVVWWRVRAKAFDGEMIVSLTKMTQKRVRQHRKLQQEGDFNSFPLSFEKRKQCSNTETDIQTENRHMRRGPLDSEILKSCHQKSISLSLSLSTEHRKRRIGNIGIEKKKKGFHC
jgi:hypothetical protein